MKTFSMWVALTSSLVAAPPHQHSKVPEPRFHVAVIPATQLPAEFTARTFSYRFNEVNADSLLAVLAESKIRVHQAWVPIDNMCMGPVGPRFTIELTRNDKRVAGFGFAKGPGRLQCATRLKWYTLSR